MMSRFLLLNFEDFGLSQDITKTIQPFNPFCLCCLDRETPLIDLEKCDHSDYLDAFGKRELKQFNQLICLQCHSLLKKIKSFQQQILESFQILLSGAFTNNTINNKRLTSLMIQKTVETLHLPPDFEEMDPIQSEQNIDEEIPNSSSINNNFMTIEMDIPSNIEHSLIHGAGHLEEVNKNINAALDNNFINIELQNGSNLEQGLIHESGHLDEVNKNIETALGNNFINIELQNSSNLEHNLIQESSHLDEVNKNIEKALENNFINMELQNSSNLEHNLIQDSSQLDEVNKNIKTALEILERNNQSFVSLGSQLQFLNGEHLSFLEPSLLCKEILTDIPLVPAKNLSTDLDNGLIDNSKGLEIEIDGSEKIFYDSLGLSPDLMLKDTTHPGINEIEIGPTIQTQDKVPQINKKVSKPRKKRKIMKSDLTVQLKAVRLTQDELNKERVQQAQSDVYLGFKFRCETCLISFHYEANLDDHVKRKHGPREGDNVVCDICSQVIPTPGAMTAHNYRHYTRYECIQCGKRYHTYDEAVRHLFTSHYKNAANKTKSKLKQRQFKKSKLKDDQEIQDLIINK